MVKLKRKHDSVILPLQPNRSANWRQNKLIIIVIVAFVMITSIAWSVMGAWVILPFAGFEVGLLAFLMYRVSYSTWYLVKYCRPKIVCGPESKNQNLFQT
jgi:Flp pilus assembly protein TadB